MPKKKHAPKAAFNDPTDIRYYLHHPHDRYIRAILQHRTAALEIIAFALDAALRNLIDLSTLQLSNNSFVDEQLQISIADICYEGLSKTGKPFRICLLFEHKSDMPIRGLYEQLNRYINNIWLEDQKQSRAPTLSIPILIYHGRQVLIKETPSTLFPDAPPELLRFVPLFDYAILDVSAMTEEEIDRLGPNALRHIFLALKFSRNEAYLRQYWRKVLIFAQVFHNDSNLQFIIKYTLLYMTSVSKTVQKILENPATNMSVEEEDLVLPYVFVKYQRKYRKEGLEEGRKEGLKLGLEEGRQEGMALLIRKFMAHHPEMSEDAIAAFFEVDLELVKAAKKH